MKANVYVDGFNLYYGCLKDTPYRWLDLAKLCQLLLPSHEINRIRYFTALLTPRPANPLQPQRQLFYLRALQTIPNLTIHYGHFLTNTVRMPLAHSSPTGPQTETALVLKTEEKGTDVNLTTYMMADSLSGESEMAVLLSNDSDFKTPIEFLRSQLGMTVGVFNPQRTKSWALYQASDFYRPIRRGPLGASQFPSQLSDAQGTITKPRSW